MTALALLIIIATMSLFVWLCVFHPVLAIMWLLVALALSAVLSSVCRIVAEDQ